MFSTNTVIAAFRHRLMESVVALLFAVGACWLAQHSERAGK